MSRLDLLHPYPFERLARLKAGAVPPANLAHIAMSIGEPQHPPPPFVLETLRANLHQVGSYPATIGLPELRAACAGWLERRFGLGGGRVDPATMVLPINGTREALFAFAQATVDPSAKPAPTVVMPNPFYQIYEGAALLAGAEPVFAPQSSLHGGLPDLDAVPVDAWRRCQLLYLCSPGNPTGAVMDLAYLQHALELAERYDFVIAADECYCELYADEDAPPPSLLVAARAAGLDRYQRCIVFHSLSKRSNLPGLRSGFVAGDPARLARFLLYRTYHGSAMAVPTQLASIAAWNDDAHVVANRELYRAKYAGVLPILGPVLGVERPAGGFYLWADVGGDDERFARELFAAQNVTVLPGSYLARDSAGGNPGRGRVRITLVADLDACVEAARRIRAFIEERGR
ncbi:MAG: succinyldiaminopimelate transaminase [Sinobacteraceae bacterium]|nr:succinyldiaminopimelate transaminase [Nevskiaceae bacterium]MCP5360596.1 succinyldiaminopimelate transaminase [Nevskiaceae bacterium]MCP5467210.1 succinyldiaminopimelate transaminase [Nevskiaceae bacterium]